LQPVLAAAAAHPQRQLGALARPQHHAQRVGERGRRQLPHRPRVLEVEAPAAELDQRALQSSPEVGELIGGDRGRRRQLAAANDARLLQLPQSLGEDVGGRAADVAGQLGEAQRPEQQLADDQQRPALADPVESSGETARLVVEALGHASMLAV
jgi:hypothetical protein